MIPPSPHGIKTQHMSKYKTTGKQTLFDAEGIKALQTPGHLVAVIVLTAAVAVLGIWLCARTDKKSAKLLA